MKMEFADGATDKFSLSTTNTEDQVTVSAAVTARMQRTEGVASCQLSFESEDFTVQSDVFEIPVARAVNDAISAYISDSPAAFNELSDAVDDIEARVESLEESVGDLGDTVDDLNETVGDMGDELYDLSTAVDDLANAGNAVSVTYAALKTLRDGGNLVPGRVYRITDFVTTVSDAYACSAGHAFDVVVTALSANAIDENARATRHTGDTYFSACDLSAWEIKYSLDNDVNRFDWADSVSGKGVIFYMKDEYGNECGYDFKNVMFARYKRATYSASDAGILPFYPAYVNSVGWRINYATPASNYVAVDRTMQQAMSAFFDMISPSEYFQTCGDDEVSSFDWQMFSSSDTRDYGCIYCSYKRNSTAKLYAAKITTSATQTSKWFYTFSTLNGASLADNPTVYDATVYNGSLQNSSTAKCNVIKPYNAADDGPFVLNNIVIVEDHPDSCYANYFDYDCRNISTGFDFCGNKFGNNCNSLIFGNGCQNNVIGAKVTTCSFGNNCSNNVLGNNCNGVVFGNACSNNRIGNLVVDVLFGSSCGKCVLMDGCMHIVLTSECESIFFGNNCYYVTLEHACIMMRFGGHCTYMRFADDAFKVELGDGCSYMIFPEAAVSSLTIDPGVKGTSAIIRLVVDDEFVIEQPTMARLFMDVDMNFVIERKESFITSSYVYKEGVSDASWTEGD